MRRIHSVIALLLAPGLFAAAAPPKLVYVKKGTREETLLASLKASGLPSLEGKWFYIGPFDNTGGEGFDTAFPPEKEIALKKTYSGKGGARAEWRVFSDFRVGHVNNLARFTESAYSCVYLYHEIEAKEALSLPVSLGSDDTLTVWLNGERLLAQNVARPAAPDQDHATLKLKPGKNQLLVKVCNGEGDWAFYIRPAFPPAQEAQLANRLDRDFPNPHPAGNAELAAEARHYRLVTVPVPADIVLEVGGLGFRPDGKLLVCTRRGEVWLVSHPEADDPEQVKFQLFATGLHEPLGLLATSNRVVYVVQRPELTKLIDKDGDGVADLYQTVCDRWGVSGDYHEFAYGPARDRDGNFFITLNVGFGGGHQAKGAFRGWCVKVTPKGELVPVAVGLRSPNGLNFSPDGDLFYTDNQGEWVATCKMHHVRPGEYYGHPAGLRWLKDSPYAGKFPEEPASGMFYDGQPPPGKTSPRGLPPVTPPCIWFPYGRMGQSASEPRWDTTGGKFGPFAGQCFVGDQTRSMVMRVYLEMVRGRYQGACFPFRSGFQSGINRLVFGPDGSLYAGQTDRGWGSAGGKSYGLQRLVYTSVLPLEIYAMKLTRAGFDLTFTKPLDAASANRLAGYSLQSFTHYYWSTYGSPEVDRKAEKVRGVKLSADGRTVSLAVTGLRPGRVYEVHLDGVKSADGDPVLHPEGYYTLNDLP
jgi:hypothetical protein